VIPSGRAHFLVPISIISNPDTQSRHFSHRYICPESNNLQRKLLFCPLDKIFPKNRPRNSNIPKYFTRNSQFLKDLPSNPAKSLTSKDRSQRGLNPKKKRAEKSAGILRLRENFTS
jgi:hypothetical protein